MCSRERERTVARAQQVGNIWCAGVVKLTSERRPDAESCSPSMLAALTSVSTPRPSAAPHACASRSASKPARSACGSELRAHAARTLLTLTASGRPGWRSRQSWYRARAAVASALLAHAYSTAFSSESASGMPSRPRHVCGSGADIAVTYTSIASRSLRRAPAWDSHGAAV